MTTRLLVLSTALLLTTVATAQQNSRSGAVREQPDANKAVQIRGHVENSGARLSSDDGGVFLVTNPAILARDAGRIVTVKCVLSKDQNSIQVLSVHSSEPKYVAAYGDSAFRR
jgi:hypothetical protein